MTVWNAYFGIPLGAVYSNLLASVICVGFVFFRMRARMIRQHAQSLAQAKLHHQEKLDQAEAHHQAAMEQAGADHQALVKQAEVHHQALVKHLGKQSAHLVRQDNAMRDLKGPAPAPRTAAERRREARIAGMGPMGSGV